ncbi:MAG: nucleoside deaminase [Desulfobulbia bacterium]
MSGTEPFGAVIVKDGNIIGEGLNRSKLNHDPTSHGETEAIRDACRNLQTVYLKGCDLYTSCEPCALCVAALEIIGISRVYYAVKLEQSNTAIGTLPESARHPIDSARLRIECSQPIYAGSIPSQHMNNEKAIKILETWVKKMKTAVSGI